MIHRSIPRTARKPRQNEDSVTEIFSVTAEDAMYGIPTQNDLTINPDNRC